MAYHGVWSLKSTASRPEGPLANLTIPGINPSKDLANLSNSVGFNPDACRGNWPGVVSNIFDDGVSSLSERPPSGEQSLSIFRSSWLDPTLADVMPRPIRTAKVAPV